MTNSKAIIRLDKRLGAILQLMPQTEIFADIGADHAQLAVAAVTSGKVKRAIATDIAEMPLESARSLIDRYFLTDTIETRLGAGLEPLRAGEVRGIVIAGMGGKMIQNILSDDFAKWSAMNFGVFQPQNNESGLRKFILRSGGKILQEQLVEENGIIYQIMLATPQGGMQSQTSDWTKADLAYGRASDRDSVRLRISLMQRDLAFLRKVLGEIRKSDKLGAAQRRLVIEEKIRRLETMLQQISEGK